MLVSGNSTPDKAKVGIDNHVKINNVELTKKCFVIRDVLGEDEHEDGNTTLGRGISVACRDTTVCEKVS